MISLLAVAAEEPRRRRPGRTGRGRRTGCSAAARGAPRRLPSPGVTPRRRGGRAAASSLSDVLVEQDETRSTSRSSHSVSSISALAADGGSRWTDHDWLASTPLPASRSHARRAGSSRACCSRGTAGGARCMPLAQDRRQLAGDVRAREVADVVVLGDDVAVARGIAAHHRAVQLDDDRALVGVELDVAVGHDDRHRRRLAAVDEAAAVRAVGLRLVPDEVVGLAGLLERPLERVVVVRRQDDLARHVALAQACRATAARNAVQLRRRVDRLQRRAHVLVQRLPAQHRVHVLRDAHEVAVVGVGVVRPRRRASTASSTPLGRKSPSGAHAVSSGGRRGSRRRRGTGTTSPSSIRLATRK